MTEKEIIELFDYKAMLPDEKKKQFELIKEQGKCFALTIQRNTPPGEQQLDSIVAVHRSCMIATAALTNIKKFVMGQPVEENKDEHQ